jgi:hypothetical protein
MKIPALTVLTVVLSIPLAASAAHAGGKPTSGDFHSDQAQGHNGGHVHNDGGRVVGSDF